MAAVIAVVLLTLLGIMITGWIFREKCDCKDCK